MATDTIMELLSDAVFTAFKLALPLLIISVVVGLIVAIFQAATQVHEQTLTFVPKLIATGIALLVLGSWMSETLNDFTYRLFESIATLV